METPFTLATKMARQECAFVVIADGFDETETVLVLSLLRQAGLCVKSVGLTSGLVGGTHGVWIMPDLTLTDLDLMKSFMSIRVVILAEGRESLSRLEADPRVHRLLRQVVAQRGQIVTSREGLRVTQAAMVCGNKPGEINEAVLLRESGALPEAFFRDLIRRLKRPRRA